jgi:hypothetical protein
MTGTGLLALTLISMGWLFFLAGLAINYAALRRSRQGKPASPMALLPGMVGSVTLFFSITALARAGLDVPWPWLWILLPLVIDPYCAPGLLRLLRK